MINVKYKNALGEVLIYFKGLDGNDLKKIPEKLMSYIKENANQVPEFDYKAELKDMHISNEAKSIIAYICYEYWCDDNTKEVFSKILKENSLEFENTMRKQYNIEDKFKTSNSNKENTSMIVVSNNNEKKSLFKKIIEKIKLFLGGI